MIMCSRKCRLFGFTLIELMIVIAIIAILAAILVPNFVKSRAQAHLTACKSNVKNIGTACEMYATNNDGRYPSSLGELTVGSTSGYLKVIPSCPSAGSDTYTAWYTYATNPDAFTVRCGGANHLAVDVSAGYPMYDSTAGLLCYGDEVAMGGGSGGSGSGVPSPEEVINNLNGDGGGGSGGSGGSGGGGELPVFIMPKALVDELNDKVVKLSTRRMAGQATDEEYAALIAELNAKYTGTYCAYWDEDGVFHEYDPMNPPEGVTLPETAAAWVEEMKVSHPELFTESNGADEPGSGSSGSTEPSEDAD